MIWRLYTLILILILAFPFSVGAQERAREILINYVESTDERDRVGLQIYFTLVDAGGEVVTDAGLRSAEIVTLDQTTPARIDSNLAPLNLIFLLDMSGSMASHFKDMQQAAIRAIEQAPSDAQINIITFDDMNEPDGFQPTGFRSKLNAIEVVRDLRHERSYGTCLYDAIYNSLELMRNQSPDNRTRRAVVAFTDGKDRLRSDNPERCSFHTADDVIRSAGNRELPMPIYTIGLGDIDRDLPDVATQTGGLHIESQSGGLVNAFSKMMTGLTSQWLVSAQAFGIAGDNEGTLKIVLNDGIEISQTFKYWSSNDKLPDPDPTPSPEPPPTILKFDTIPKKEERRYQVDLEASNLSQVFRWELRIYGEDGNKVQEFSYSSDQIDQISFSAETLNPEETYTIELSAFDLDNQIIFNPREGTVLATREFVHWPELLPTPQLEIGHPVIDKEIGILTSTIRTNLNLPINADWRIVDKETGFLVDLTPTLKGVDTYEISLDDLDFGEYILNLSAVDSNGIVIFEAEPIEVYWPITQCNIVCRIVKAFTKQWPMLIVILLVILGSIGLNRWVTYRDDRNTGTPTLPDIIQDGEKPSEVDITALAQLPDDAPRRRGRVSQTNPSIEDNWRGFQEVRTRSRPGSHQDVVPQAMSSDGAAAIQPTYDPDPMPIANLGTQRATLTLSQDQAQVIVIDKEEFTLGRDACDLTIDTPLITRKHARILQRNGHYYLEDLQSSNYTFLNDNKIEPHYQMRLKSGDQIGLGKRTRILFKLAESS